MQAPAIAPKTGHGIQSTAIDGLIAGYFDQAYLLFNVFVDDPRTCLDLADAVFRGMDADEPSTLAFYSNVVTRVRGLTARNELAPGLSTDAVLCWLLKDSADLTYQEIAVVMCVSRQDVKLHIAAVRQALVG